MFREYKNWNNEMKWRHGKYLKLRKAFECIQVFNVCTQLLGVQKRICIRQTFVNSIIIYFEQNVIEKEEIFTSYLYHNSQSNLTLVNFYFAPFATGTTSFSIISFIWKLFCHFSQQKWNLKCFSKRKSKNFNHKNNENKITLDENSDSANLYKENDGTFVEDTH